MSFWILYYLALNTLRTELKHYRCNIAKLTLNECNKDGRRMAQTITSFVWPLAKQDGDIHYKLLGKKGLLLIFLLLLQ